MGCPRGRRERSARQRAAAHRDAADRSAAAERRRRYPDTRRARFETLGRRPAVGACGPAERNGRQQQLGGGRGLHDHWLSPRRERHAPRSAGAGDLVPRAAQDRRVGRRSRNRLERGHASRRACHGRRLERTHRLGIHQQLRQMARRRARAVLGCGRGGSPGPLRPRGPERAMGADPGAWRGRGAVSHPLRSRRAAAGGASGARPVLVRDLACQAARGEQLQSHEPGAREHDAGGARVGPEHRHSAPEFRRGGSGGAYRLGDLRTHSLRGRIPTRRWSFNLDGRLRPPFSPRSAGRPDLDGQRTRHLRSRAGAGDRRGDGLPGIGIRSGRACRADPRRSAGDRPPGHAGRHAARSARRSRGVPGTVARSAARPPRRGQPEESAAPRGVPAAGRWLGCGRRDRLGRIPTGARLARAHRGAGLGHDPGRPAHPRR